MSQPQIASPSEYLASRLSLLEKEKALTRAQDELAAIRRSLPVVPLTKDYTFTSFDVSKKTPVPNIPFAQLFQGRAQLIIYHFMFDPSSEAGCSSCSLVGDHLPRSVSHLNNRNTSFAVVSRAPIEKIIAFRARMGWSLDKDLHDFPWYSSHDSSFNYDFHVTQDPAFAPVEYNFRSEAQLLERKMPWFTRGEQPGVSVFLKIKSDDEEEAGGKETICHAYSTYSRGVESLINTYGMLDLTPLGRQEDSANGITGFKYHDEYEPADLEGKLLGTGANGGGPATVKVS